MNLAQKLDKQTNQLISNPVKTSFHSISCSEFFAQVLNTNAKLFAQHEKWNHPQQMALQIKLLACSLSVVLRKGKRKRAPLHFFRSCYVFYFKSKPQHNRFHISLLMNSPCVLPGLSSSCAITCLLKCALALESVPNVTTTRGYRWSQEVHFTTAARSL